MPYEAADGAMVVLPRLEDGGLEVMACLEAAAMERLMADEDFGRFAQGWA